MTLQFTQFFRQFISDIHPRIALVSAVREGCCERSQSKGISIHINRGIDFKGKKVHTLFELTSL